MVTKPNSTAIAVRKRDKYTCQMCGRVQGELFRPGNRVGLYIHLWPSFDPSDTNPDHYRVVCHVCLYRIRFGMMADPDGNWHTDEQIYSRVTRAGYKGIYRIRRCPNRPKPWCAYIYVNRKTIHLGYHRTEEEAARVHDDARVKYFGEGSRINFPDV